MTGWIFAVLFLAAFAGLGFTTLKSQRRARRDYASLDLVNTLRQNREHRLFEFLHALGEATLNPKGDHDASMHRLIADGVAKVLGAQGGVVYLLDAAGKYLVPRGMSKDCPPLVGLPERVVEQERTNPGKMLSFLKLHSFASDAGFLGEIYTTQTAVSLPDLRRHPKFGGAANPYQNQVAVLAAPLAYGSRKLGVIAAATERAERSFDDEALRMMKTLAEQCALALGNRQVQQEAKEKDRLEAELRTASEIQRILLPDKAPEMPGFRISGKNLPARHVSGDYYDFFPVGDQHIGLVIADVSGKGVPASLITAMCRSVLRANARDVLSPSAVLSIVNRNLFPDIREDMFISMIYAVVARDGSSMSLARAGHTDPLLWRHKSGKVEIVSAPGVAVGFDKGDVFDRVTKDVNVYMEPGDCLLLYTDGVNEATDHKGLLFGEEKIQEVLEKMAPEGAPEVVEGITQAVKAFMSGDPQQDDITLIAIKRNF